MVTNVSNRDRPLHLMDLPLEVLYLIRDQVYGYPADDTAVEVYEAAKQQEEPWALRLVPTRTDPGSSVRFWNKELRQVAINNTAHRIALDRLLNLRLVDKFWPDHGAQRIVEWSQTFRGFPRRTYSMLNFRLELSSIQRFFLVGRNPILARAVRFIQIEDMYLNLVLFPAHGEESRASYYLGNFRAGPAREQVNDIALGNDQTSGQYLTYLEKREECITLLERLLSTDSSAIALCAKNLTTVHYLGFWVDPLEQERRLCQSGQHPKVLHDYAAYRSLLPNAFIQAGVRPGNMFKQGETMYLADISDDYTTNPIVAPLKPERLSELLLDAVAPIDHQDTTCSEFDWIDALNTTRSLKHLTINDNVQDSNSLEFSMLSNRIIVDMPLHKKLRLINLVSIRIHLLNLAEALAQIAGMHHANRIAGADPQSCSLRMVNVRAEATGDWLAFLTRTKEVVSPEYCRSWKIEEWPHPAREGASQEWEHIRDIVDKYCADAPKADIAAYLRED